MTLGRTLATVVLIAAVLAGGSVSAQATTTKAATLQPTPTFNSKWKQAKKSFAKCQYTSAWKRYELIKSRGLRLADPVLRFKFYHGLATSAYKAGHRKSAKGYATLAVTLNQQMTVMQQDKVESVATDIADIILGEYRYWC